MENKTNVYIKVEGNGQIPQYSSVNAAGCDLFATQDLQIKPGETKLMPLHFSMAIDAEIEAQIRPRSGLSLRTELRVPNSPATIDSDYRDMVSIILQNTYNNANLPYQIAQDPKLLGLLKKEFKEITLMEYIAMNSEADLSEYKDIPVLNERLYVDSLGNPFGTIYIKRGDRIAQMVFSEYKRANFILHHDPKEIGQDRGGGFGHTGL